MTHKPDETPKEYAIGYSYVTTTYGKTKVVAHNSDDAAAIALVILRKSLTEQCQNITIEEVGNLP